MFTLRENKGTYEFLDKNTLLASYTYDRYHWYPYIHPVNTQDGHTITMEWPGDHPWHCGMYFAWKYINGINVWDRVSSGIQGAAPVHKTIIDVTDNDKPAIKHTIEWVDKEGKHLLHDSRIVRLVPLETKGAYAIDWELEFHTDLEKVILDREEKWGGYAGMMTRLARNVSPEIRSNLDTKIDTESPTEPFEWVDYNYSLDGLFSETNFEHKAGLVTMLHPGNPVHPQRWCTYFESHIQGLHPAILKDKPMTLKKGSLLELKYRHIIYRGIIEYKTIQNEYDRYCAT